jgi:hypothetical protein
MFTKSCQQIGIIMIITILTWRLLGSLAYICKSSRGSVLPLLFTTLMTSSNITNAVCGVSNAVRSM